MLLEFTVANFLSFRDRKTLRLKAGPSAELAQTNIVRRAGLPFLRSAVIYGDNASGKSNFIKAMTAMRTLVLQAHNAEATQDIRFNPFLLDAETSGRPSLFEAVFLIEDALYRYGFEADDAAIRSEWLYGGKEAEKALFTRDKSGITVTDAFPEGKNREKETPAHLLFLAVVDQFKGEKARDILYWFNNMLPISGLEHMRHRDFTYSLMEQEETAALMKEFYKKANIGMDDVKLTKKLFDPASVSGEVPDSVRQEVSDKLEGRTMVDVVVRHKKYSDGKASGKGDFDIDYEESEGCAKLFDISGPVFDVLQSGGVLAVDELDEGLHPRITNAVAALFYSEQYNPNGAQLLFTTRDSHLVTFGNYRPDQVYFTEKDSFGASDLYSLADYGNPELVEAMLRPRNPGKIIPGRHGRIPFMN
jgi:hypothetical protein